MTLAPGARLGPFEVSSKLGEGGMGVVWRARDVRLGRDVALKVLPQEVAADPERLARFEREATVLAQLNHPNIAGIHGLEAEGDVRALVMELVEGPTLDRRLEHGALPVGEALEIARQIAAALEEAHEHGIVHRDLKPQNVKAPVEGTVKVLDFGLAKAIEPASDPQAPAGAHSPTFMNSPTLTAPGGTRLGVILGTASYMAPEQARGVPLDRRADIWSFGVVLFEMLAGQRLFEGELVTDVLASVLKQDVDHSALPAETPPAIRRLLRRCLERRPRNRLRDIGDARLVIDEVLEGRDDLDAPAVAGSLGPARFAMPRWVAPALGIAVALAGAVGWLVGHSTVPATASPTPPETRLALALPRDLALEAAEYPALAISPDGRRQVIVVRAAGGPSQLLLRDLSVVEPWILAGTEGASTPFFSPDGEWVAFFGPNGLTKIPVAGGSPQQLTEARPNPRGGTWSADGYLYFAPGTNGSLLRVPEGGGSATEVLRLDEGRAERTHRWPSALPDGSAVIFTADTVLSPDYYDDARIDAIRPATGERLTLVEGASQARFLPPDHLVFAKGGVLSVVELDPRTLGVHGEPRPVLPDVAGEISSGAVHYDVSHEGSLAWVPAEALKTERPIERFSSELEPQPFFLDSDTLRRLAISPEQLAVSPDGKRLAVVATSGRATDLWVADLERETWTRRTFGTQVADPTWTPDGHRIAFSMAPVDTPERERDVYWLTVAGGEDPELLFATPGTDYPSTFSVDGRTLVYEYSDDSSLPELWVVDLDEGGRGRPWADSGSGFHGEMSPDGRWLAQATGGGRAGVFVRSFPDARARWQIAPVGFEPHWSADGSAVYYRNDGTLWRVPVELDGDVTIGAPVALLDRMAPNGSEATTYDVGPDGELWLVRRTKPAAGDAQVNLITGWTP